jgi:prepilin-type N-terminal cleavage/methylation domain-containing protein
MLDRRMKQRGDTIIEVLLAMVVIGMTLSIGFSIANNALQTGRLAAERSEALKLAETQLEILKASLASDTQPKNFDSSAPYCLLVIDTKTPIANCNGVNGSFYNLRMDYKPASGSNPSSYKSSVTWEPPNSTAPAVVEVLYRAYDE